jgi:hypothetical protein
MVWHIVALNRTKKLPDLKKLLHQEPRRRQTWQEQLEIAKMWAKVTNTRIYSTNQDNP